MYAAADHREGSGRVIQSEISNLKSEILFADLARRAALGM
jgi:hypothetical protein